MTAPAQLPGRTGHLRADGWRVNVRILAVKQAYGRVRVLCENQADCGPGEMPEPPRWVGVERVMLGDSDGGGEDEAGAAADPAHLDRLAAEVGAMDPAEFERVCGGRVDE